MSSKARHLSHSDLLQLQRWNTPTIYNGWEQITQHNPGTDAFNIEETRDFMPQMGPMVGYAVTLVIEPSNAAHRAANPNAGEEFRRYIASMPGPKSGLGTVKAAMPTISSTPSTAWRVPTMARPSVNTAHKAATMQACTSA